MGWESSDVVRFNLEHLCQGQTSIAKLKVLITCFLLILEVCNLKPTCRISWAGNLLTSDLTFGPYFKVKRWFSGFGELSFQWIQICIGSRCVGLVLEMYCCIEKCKLIMLKGSFP